MKVLRTLRNSMAKTKFYLKRIERCHIEEVLANKDKF